MKKSKGFTLVEMLIAIVLVSLLTLVITKILLTNTRVFTKNTINSAFQSDARLTLRYLSKDFKSATSVEVPAIGQSSNDLRIRVNGNPPIVNYGLDDASGELNRENTRLARRLVNAANTLFTRPSRNTLQLRMRFNDPAMKPNSIFTFEATLNLKSAVVLTLEPANGIVANLNSVYFLNQNNGWAAGNNGTILSYGNNTWTNRTGTNMQSLPRSNLNSVFLLGNNLGYAAGDDGTILKFNGINWAVENSDINGAGNNINDIYPEDENSIIAVGVRAGQGVSTAFDGNNWVNSGNRPPKFPAGYNPQQLNSISGYLNERFTAADNTIYWWEPSWTGDYWWNVREAYALPNVRLNDTSTVLPTPPTPDSPWDYEMWVVGDSGTIIRHRQGGIWDDMTNTNPQPAGQRENLNSVYFFDDNNGYAVGNNGTILRFNSGNWQQLESPTNVDLNEVYLYGNDGGWIVGDGGTRIKIGEF